MNKRSCSDKKVHLLNVILKIFYNFANATLNLQTSL